MIIREMCEIYKIILISDREMEVIVLVCDFKNGVDEYLEFIYNKKINL